jgi:hypothetical protein
VNLNITKSPAFMGFEFSLETLINSASSQAMVFAESLYSYFNTDSSVWSDNPKRSRSTGVNSLLCSGSPCAVVFAITFFVIYSVQGGLFIFNFLSVSQVALIHICLEVFKTVPALTHSYASSTIIMVSLSLFISASLPHIQPNTIKHSGGKIVGRDAGSALCRLPSSEIISEDCRDISTFTLANKLTLVFSGIRGFFKYSPVIESVPGFSFFRQIARPALNTLTASQTVGGNRHQSPARALAIPVRSPISRVKHQYGPLSKLHTSQIHFFAHVTAPLLSLLVKSFYCNLSTVIVNSKQRGSNGCSNFYLGIFTNLMPSKLLKPFTLTGFKEVTL